MRLLFAAAALAFSLTAAPAALAQQAAPADVTVIDRCLKTAEEADSLGSQCIGLVADPCIKNAGNDTAKSKACAARELAVWTVKMDQGLKQVRAGGFADISKAVADAQKSFVASRDRFCAVLDKVEPGTYPGSANYCRLHETATRTLNLIKLGAAVNEH